MTVTNISDCLPSHAWQCTQTVHRLQHIPLPWICP